MVPFFLRLSSSQDKGTMQSCSILHICPLMGTWMVATFGSGKWSFWWCFCSVCGDAVLECLSCTCLWIHQYFSEGGSVTVPGV
jgi:hypothetical protein